MEGLFPIPTPVVLGHESSAVVVAVGEGITYVEPGDHVITCPSVFCGACPLCLRSARSPSRRPHERFAPRRGVGAGRHQIGFAATSPRARADPGAGGAIARHVPPLPRRLVPIISPPKKGAA